MKLIISTRVFVTGLRIFSTFPTVISPDGTIKTSKALKGLFTLTILLFSCFITYFFGFLQVPSGLKTNLYYFLGYLRGAFFVFCSAANAIVILIKSDDLTEIARKLNEFQSSFKFSNKRLMAMFCVVVIELISLYLRSIVMICLLCNNEIKNVVFRLAAAIGTDAAVAPMYATEVIIINSVMILSKYFDMINEQIILLHNEQPLKISRLAG